MTRCCFTPHVRPDRTAEHRERHAAVWPEMLAALRDAGWHEHTLHLRGDGLLVGVVTTDDLDAQLDAPVPDAPHTQENPS